MNTEIILRIVQEDTLSSLSLKYSFIKGAIYKVKKEDFKYCLSMVTGNYWVGDCYPCSKNGKLLKGYEKPVPVLAESLDRVIGYKGKKIIKL